MMVGRVSLCPGLVLSLLWGLLLFTGKVHALLRWNAPPTPSVVETVAATPSPSDPPSGGNTVPSDEAPSSFEPLPTPTRPVVEQGPSPFPKPPVQTSPPPAATTDNNSAQEGLEPVPASPPLPVPMTPPPCSLEKDALRACYSDLAVTGDGDDEAWKGCDSCVTAGLPRVTASCQVLEIIMCAVISGCDDTCGPCQSEIEVYLDCAFNELVDCRLFCGF